MARPLQPGLIVDPSADESKEHEQVQASRRLDRSAARAFAAAISSLIIATLVVSQSAEALDPDGTVAGNSFEAGTVELVDDDLGRSLFDLTNMAPGRPVEECITVSYEGTILPVEVTLGATTSGELAPYLSVEVESGNGGGFGSCDGFEPAQSVFSGTIWTMAALDPRVVGTLRNQGDGITFRFRFELLDDGRAVGQATALDFVWEAVPS